MKKVLGVRRFLLHFISYVYSVCSALSPSTLSLRVGQCDSQDVSDIADHTSFMLVGHLARGGRSIDVGWRPNCDPYANFW